MAKSFGLGRVHLRSLAISLLVFLGSLVWLPAQATAGILFQGVNGFPVLFIPPVNTPLPQATFTVGAPQFILNSHQPLDWRIRDPGVPFWPVPNGIPLIKDNTLATAPFLTPAGVWGIWDPPVTQIVANQQIRVFEIFTGLNTSATPVGNINLSGLQSVSGLPGLTVSSFPTNVVMNQPVGLNPAVNIISNDFIGIVTGTTYHTTLQESSFATLDADIAALSPGTSNPYDTQFQGATGRVVISYADMPMEDAIGYAELVPEPSTLVLCALGAVGLVGYGWAKGRNKRKSA
jgi:hypothetical protein